MSDDARTTRGGVDFFDEASKRQMRYVYPDTDHWTAGWIMVRGVDGLRGMPEWVTLRKATERDVAAITAAIVREHHKA